MNTMFKGCEIIVNKNHNTFIDNECGHFQDDVNVMYL